MSYQELYKAFQAANKDKSGTFIQNNVNRLWKELKDLSKTPQELQSNTLTKIKEFLERAAIKKAQITLFYTQHKKITSVNQGNAQNKEQTFLSLSGTAEKVSGSSNLPESRNVQAADHCVVGEHEEIIAEKKAGPMQEACRMKISNLQSQVKALDVIINSPMSTAESRSLKRKLEIELNTEDRKLKRLKNDQIRQVKSREQKKIRLQSLIDSDPEAAKILKVRSSLGRPRIEEKCPELLQTIIDIASFGGGCDVKRRSEMIRSCKTLEELNAFLNRKLNLSISKSALYTRLLPHRSNTAEGRRHVKTVPVKLVKAETSEHKLHMDTSFCVATIRAVETLASVLGSHQVFFLSQDDKARVALGITAAKSQRTMLMHMQYRVILPDHDWVKAERHKLIPSVYAAIAIKDSGIGNPDGVTYSGPTIIRIRSGKHSSSNAETHAADFHYLLSHKDFEPLCKTPKGSVKPVVIISTDGGPDENPRYQRVIHYAVEHFKSHDLDALYIMTNAPGRSAYNRVERRMAPLSNELSGVLLEHDHFGSHLDSQGQTVDKDLEKKNFKHAGETLSDIWNAMVIDKYPVSASYVDPNEETLVNLSQKDMTIDQNWFDCHVRSSQYLLQIVKCHSQECCKEHRSNLFEFLPNRFLPPPMKFGQTFERGLYPAKLNENNTHFVPLLVRLALKIQPTAPGFLQVPYDFYCPSVRSRLPERTCSICGISYASKKVLQTHFQANHKASLLKKLDMCSRVRPVNILRYRNNEALCTLKTDDQDDIVEWLDVENIDTENVIDDMQNTNAMSEAMPIVDDLQDWLQSPWKNDDEKKKGNQS